MTWMYKYVCMQVYVHVYVLSSSIQYAPKLYYVRSLHFATLLSLSLSLATVRIYVRMFVFVRLPYYTGLIFCFMRSA